MKKKENEVDLLHLAKKHYFAPIYIDRASIRAFIVAVIVCFMLMGGLAIVTKTTESVSNEERINQRINKLEKQLEVHYHKFSSKEIQYR